MIIDPPFITTATLPVCECCYIALANADTSGCEHYCGDNHAERLCNFGVEANEQVEPDDAVESGGAIRCSGCGDDTLHAANVAVLRSNRDHERKGDTGMGERKQITADELVSLADAVRDLDAQRDRARLERDEAIRQALRGGMTAYRVAQVTGLDERGVGRIREKGV